MHLRTPATSRRRAGEPLLHILADSYSDAARSQNDDNGIINASIVNELNAAAGHESLGQAWTWLINRATDYIADAETINALTEAWHDDADLYAAIAAAIANTADVMHPSNGHVPVLIQWRSVPGATCAAFTVPDDLPPASLARAISLAAATDDPSDQLHQRITRALPAGIPSAALTAGDFITVAADTYRYDTTAEPVIQP